MQYDSVSPKMSGLLVKLQYINDTILELPTAMSDAYTSLYDAKSNMVSALVWMAATCTCACLAR